MPLLPPIILLNADGDPGGFIFQIGGAVLGLIAVVVAGWFAIVRIRAWMHTSEDTSAPFTLDDLRRLHREGKLSDAEFQRAREAMIGAVRSQKTRESDRSGGASVDPELARSIEAERREAERASNRGSEARSPTQFTDQPGGSNHGKTVVRRPDILRRPPEGGTGKREE
ncbi:MAG: hypothetical protein LW806_11290 [Planctomycetaceae bacterium]|nr:hypothetical protein [Planctomycetaceae bacterium]